MNVTEMIEAHFSDMVDLRRHLHAHPELSFKEFKTKEYIYEQLKDLNLNIETNVGGNGLVAKLHMSDDYETVALRADFDALPIQDDKDVPYKSKHPGIMHACGHDAHTAMLITIAKILSANREKLNVNVTFIFQHAEELVPGGAIDMLKAGAVEDVDYIYGVHVASGLPTGVVGYQYGVGYAYTDMIEILVKGSGGHGAAPHTTKDPIVASASLIQQLQTITSRAIDPLKSSVITIGIVDGGTVFNVIPSNVTLKGTVRTLDYDVKNLVKKRIKNIANGISESFNMEVEVKYTDGYPALVNDDNRVDFMKSQLNHAKYVHDTIEMEPTMGGEDFAYFLQSVKGCYFHIGVGNVKQETNYPHHHSKFDIDEVGMKTGVEVLLKTVLAH